MGGVCTCPACAHRFAVAAPVPSKLVCPACGESIAVRTPAATPTPESKEKPATLKRACPSCGSRYVADRASCPECGASYQSAKREREESEGAFAPEKAGIRAGVLGGVAMVVIAAVWFFVGLAAGRIFFYPPVLAVIGVYAVVKGLSTGNLAGARAVPRRPRRARPRSPDN